MKKGDVLFRIDPTPYQLDGQHPRGAARQRASRAARAEERRAARRPRSTRRAARSRRPRAAIARGRAKLDAGAQARRAEPRARRRRGAGTRFDLEQAETDVARARGPARPRRAAPRRRRASARPGHVGERQSSRSSARTSNGEFAQVAQIRAQLENAKWDARPDHDAVALRLLRRSTCSCARARFVAGLPINPVMTLRRGRRPGHRALQPERAAPGRARQRGRVRAEDHPRHASSRARSTRSSGRRARARCSRAARSPLTGAARDAAGPLRGQVRHRRARQGALPRRRRRGRRRDLHRPLHAVHIIRKVILRVGSYIELPDPEAALRHARAWRDPRAGGPARSRRCALRAAARARGAREAGAARICRCPPHWTARRHGDVRARSATSWLAAFATRSSTRSCSEALAYNPDLRVAAARVEQAAGLRQSRRRDALSASQSRSRAAAAS